MMEQRAAGTGQADDEEWRADWRLPDTGIALAVLDEEQAVAEQAEHVVPRCDAPQRRETRVRLQARQQPAEGLLKVGAAVVVKARRADGRLEQRARLEGEVRQAHPLQRAGERVERGERCR